MLKIFLVEDESIVREGLRDNIPWEQYGYQFMGEASDGEMALPMIRKIRPDVLITDIKMPFMDGLALSRIVTQEFPDIKIIIISGYDEFEYAQQAIRVGVEQYLLKPITRNGLQKVLLELREKIESEQEQKNYIEKFQTDMQEYEDYSKRSFLEKIFAGKLSVQEIYEEAQKLSIELDGPYYNLMLLSLQEKKQNEKQVNKESERLVDLQEEIMRYFLRYSEYMVFRWNINMYGILLKGEENQMEELAERCIGNIKRLCAESHPFLDWYVAIGDPVGRLSQLPECYTKVNHIFAYRFLIPKQHVLTETEICNLTLSEESNSFEKIDVAKVDPEIVKGFLAGGKLEELQDFVEGYLVGLKDTLNSKLFRDYVLLSVRFTTIAFLESLGISQELFIEKLGKDGLREMSGKLEEVQQYIYSLLYHALSLRDAESENQGKRMLKRALEYIEENYCLETLSLNSVSTAVGVSGNYFSSIFSQEMEQTFIEYVTSKRMEKAKKLLKQEKSSSEVASQVGYKDPHYFSFVFKKTQGITPREYRNGKF